MLIYLHLFALNNESSSKINKYIREKEDVNCKMDGQPFWLHLIVTVESNAHWKYYHREYQ